MTSERAVFPEARLHARADDAPTGFWFCTRCQRVSEAEDPGETYPVCVHCRRRGGLKWKATEPAKPVVAGTPRAQELFAGLFAAVGGK